MVLVSIVLQTLLFTIYCETYSSPCVAKELLSTEHDPALHVPLTQQDVSGYG